MTRLFLIRHAEPETGWGEADPDPGLSARGREQAEAAALALEELGRLRVFSSPMLRCRETAAPYVDGTGRPSVLEPRVSEVVSPPGVVDRRAWLLENFPWRGGETRLWSSLTPDLHAWRAGVLGFARGLSEDCAVFSHFIAINALVGAARGRDATIVCRPDYASITEFALDRGGLRLVKLGAEMGAGAVH